MSKVAYMSALFNQLTSMVKELIEMYPEDPDFSIFLNSISLMKSNPSLIVKTINDNIGPFEKKIHEKDESFFLSYSFEGWGDMDVFSKLKNYITDMPPESKEAVWKYIDNIMRLAQACK